MKRTPFDTEITEQALRFGLQPELVEAVVLTESNGRTFAYNPEPKYRYFWDVINNRPFRKLNEFEVTAKTPPADFKTLAGDKDQEWWAQQASFGLMQVMGAVAREHGFMGEYLLELVSPRVGLEYGCRHLSKMMKWARGVETQALAAYNGGPVGNAAVPYRNAEYAQKVLSRRV